MLKLSESTLRQLIAGGETVTVELKRASPRPTEPCKVALDALLALSGARGSRTLTTLRSGNFKSPASTIPPSPLACCVVMP